MESSGLLLGARSGVFVFEKVPSVYMLGGLLLQ